jgi:PAS domain S-box-containing protein
MTGIWFYRFTIPLAAVFALYFNFIDFISLHGISIDQIFRGLIMIVGAVVLNYLGKTLSRKNRELKDGRNLLALEKENLRIMLLSIGDGVISTDNNGNVTFLNEVAKKLTGWNDESAIKKPFAEVFNITNEFTGEKSDDPIKKVLETGQVIKLANHTALMSKDGTKRSIADSAAPIRDENGNILGVVLVFRDVTNEKIKQNEIEYLSFHDQLTGLGNRRQMEAQLRRLDNVHICLYL